MKILVTNDDGIDAPGIAALLEVAQSFGELVTVAPEGAWSGCGHQTTTGDSIRAVEEQENRFRVWGTPADCVRLGLQVLAPDAQLVLAGINQGANLGVDMIMSGTVAAAREGMFMGRAAIAVSQYRQANSQTTWRQSAELAQQAISSVLDEAISTAGSNYWNINIPDTATESPNMVRCEPDPTPLDFEFTKTGDTFRFVSSYHDRPRSTNGDIDTCFRGDVAVSKIGRSFWMPTQETNEK